MNRIFDQNLRLVLLTTSILIIGGCIGRHPANPAATQPVTVKDLATTQPAFYLNQPTVASVDSLYFQPLWDACETVARSYGYQLDRIDYRLGLITTHPMVSKQVLEPWRRDAGTAHAVLVDSITTIRRSIRFEINNDGGTYRMTPKVLVERQTVVERRTTSAAEYHTVISGVIGETRTAVTSDDEFLPPSYWTPIARDNAMERKVAAEVDHHVNGG